MVDIIYQANFSQGEVPVVIENIDCKVEDKGIVSYEILKSMKAKGLISSVSVRSEEKEVSLI